MDAGKTTLSEAMLVCSNMRPKMGRVDNGDSFLDTNVMERERGITIFSKQAQIQTENMWITLIDTPGHVDFSMEMERTLPVLDAAILVISASDKIKSHTQTIWRLLSHYRIPVFLFINKMDQPGTDEMQLLLECREKLSDSCMNFSMPFSDSVKEEMALHLFEEKSLNQFLLDGQIREHEISEGILKRRIFPCYFGSALKMEGIETFLSGLGTYLTQKSYPERFSARVYKITRDAQNNRITFLKITGGTLHVRDTLQNHEKDGTIEAWNEKVNQIRIYSGEGFLTLQEAEAGSICGITGLSHTYAGEGLGDDYEDVVPLSEPVLTYRLRFLEDVDTHIMMQKLRILEEEDPQLHLVYNEKTDEIHIQVMGEIQIEVLKRLIGDRFGVQAAFDQGSILYKETITRAVEGVGHYEPLRHYAEVHLFMEPGEKGSGLEICSSCSEDILDKNWQHLIMTQLSEIEIRGVLTGAAVTDMRITLIAGKAHIKHTQGGDFRQAVCRALRQGLMQADSVLLEPYYRFTLKIPECFVGRAMTDLTGRNAEFTLQQEQAGTAILSGRAPIVCLRDYQAVLHTYARDEGSLQCEMSGYEICHNTQEIMEKTAYDPQQDLEYPSSSVFCMHGAGTVISWQQAAEYMHLPMMKREADTEKTTEQMLEAARQAKKVAVAREHHKDEGIMIDLEEIDKILNRTFCANKKDKKIPHSGIRREWQHKTKETVALPQQTVYRPVRTAEKYLLVDGYNVVYAWKELKELAQINLDGARGKLLDVLSHYQAITGGNLIVVFDAYKITGHQTEIFDYQNIHVVFTKEAETADQYIEHFAHENGKKYDVTVATSDGLEQIIIRGQGCHLISSRELEAVIGHAFEEFREKYL